MNNYIPIICFIAGLACGVAVTILGFWLGWKSSYEIRSASGEDVDDDKKLFRQRKDPAEFGLLDEQEERDKEIYEERNKA